MLIEKWKTEDQIVWAADYVEGEPIVERVIKAANMTGLPTSSDCRNVEPGLTLVGYAELNNLARLDNSGCYQRRAFFRHVSIAETHPSIGPEHSAHRSVSIEDALARAGVYGGTGTFPRKSQSFPKPGQLPDKVYGG